MKDNWIDVDREGMRKVLSRRPKHFILTEPIQNAWDEPITKIEVDFRMVGRNRCELVVIDDSPAGFENLTDAYTLFATSKKVGNPNLRGAFNKGCKDVMAFAVSGNIETTTGSVRFLETGERAQGRQKRRSGTQVSFLLKLNKDEYEEACAVIPMLHVPEHIHMTFNGQVIAPAIPLKIISATLPTLIADEEGILRSHTRKTEIKVFDHPCGEKWIYEMGIPVCPTGDQFSYDCSQRVPLNVERDNVPRAYLQKVRVAVANEMATAIQSAEEANADWARAATSDPNIEKTAFNHLLDLRLGEKRVSYDPSDPDAAGVAHSAGATVVHGRNLSAQEWNNARQFGSILPAGQVYPTKGEMVASRLIPKAAWNKWQRVTARYWEDMAKELLGVDLFVSIIEAPPQVGTIAKYIKSEPTRQVQWNVSHSGFPSLTMVCLEGIGVEIDDLMLHEFSHEIAESHYGHEILDAATKLGAKLKALVMKKPESFKLEYLNRPFE